MGETWEKFKDRFSYGAAKAFLTIDDLDRKYKIVTIAAAMPFFCTGSTHFLFMALSRPLTQIVMNCISAKKADPSALPESVDIQTIKNDFESTFNTYRDLKKTWGNQSRLLIQTQSELENAMQQLKDGGAEVHGKFHMHKFRSNVSGAYKFGYCFINPDTAYQVKNTILHESVHAQNKTRTSSYKCETQAEYQTLKQLKTLVKDTPEEVGYWEDHLKDIAIAFVRKAQSEGMTREQIADYFKTYQSEFKLPNYLEKTLSGSCIKRLSGKLHMKGLQCYTSDVYFKQKAEAANPVVETYPQPLCSKTA